MDDADASGARPGEGAIRFSHSGYRYVLGYGTDFFGIWDREQPGGPILRFPRTDEGWDQAWYEYVSRERHNVEVSAPAFAAAHVRASWTVAILAVHVVVGVVAVVMFLVAITEVSGLRSRPPIPGEFQRLKEHIESILAVVYFFHALPIAAIPWLLWQHRAHRNLKALGVTSPRYTPGWAVGGWFIPVASVFMPYLTMRELRHGSDPGMIERDIRNAKGTPLLRSWWALWLGSIIPLFVAGVMGAYGDITGLIAQAAWGVVYALLLSAAAILAIMLVRQIQANQQQRHALITEQDRPLPALSDDSR
jgi:hypothetical protein